MALPDSLNTVTVRKLANTLNSYNTKVNTKLDKKADKVTGATTGNLAALDGNGNITDSLSKPGDFATSAQGAKADTAVQSVSINGGTNLKSGTSVDIPLAVATGESGAKAGAMSSDDKKKLNDIATGAEVNQNAFSNVAANGTTIAATAKTDTLTIIGGTHTSVVGSTADKSVTINSTLSSKTASQGGTDVSLVTTGEKYTWGAKQEQLTFDGTYNASSNKAATVSSITSRINDLDVSNITSNLGVGKTITALSETDGKIAATASDIQITESQVTNLTSDLALKAPLDSPALTGTPTAPTAETGTNTTQIATTQFVNAEIDYKMSQTDAMVYKGTLAGGSTGDYGALTPTANKGWTYKVTTAGKIDGVAVEIGDMLICNTDNTAAATSSNYSSIKANWDFIQTNLDGAVIGPNSSTNAGVAGFDGTTGHKIKQLNATEIKTAAGLDKVKNQAITVTSTSVSDGTNTFTKYEHPTTTSVGAAAVKVGNDGLGHVVLGAALGKSDVGLGNVVNTGDSATPVENGTDKFTTGGAYTELAKKVDKVTGKDLSTNDYTDADKNKLAGIAAGAEVNQNAFSNVKIGSTTVAADTTTDTLELVGSQHISITPDATNDKITIATDIQDQTAYSAKGSATKVPQITTNSLGQVTGITEVTISGVTPASHTHGNITNDGKIGSTANRAVVTTTGGAVTTADMTVSSPTASGNTISFIDTVSQSSNGKISATKKTVSTMGAASADAAGTAGLVPAPAAGKQNSFLRGDGTWVVPTDTDTKVTQNLTTANGEYPIILKNNTTQTDSPTAATNYAAGVTINPSAKSISATTFIGALSGTADTAKAYDTTFTGTNSIKSALDGKAASSHNHGNITNAGAITTSADLGNGDAIVFTDSSDSNKLKKSSITFDGTTTTQALTKAGTWATFNNYTHPTYDTATASAVKVGRDSTGHVVIGNALTKSDVGLDLVANQTITVTTTSVSDGTNTFNKYVHPTTAGNKHIPSGGSSGQILGWSADGTATWINNSSAAHGQGYATSSGSASSSTYSITMSGYELTTGGIVAIKFTQDNVASAKLNINSKGAKNVYYRGAAITAGIIQNGDIAYFMYDGTNYVLLGTDRSVGEMTDQEVSDIIDALT